METLKIILHFSFHPFTACNSISQKTLALRSEVHLFVCLNFAPTLLRSNLTPCLRRATRPHRSVPLIALIPLIMLAPPFFQFSFNMDHFMMANWSDFKSHWFISPYLTYDFPFVCRVERPVKWHLCRLKLFFSLIIPFGLKSFFSVYLVHLKGLSKFSVCSSMRNPHYQEASCLKRLTNEDS